MPNSAVIRFAVFALMASTAMAVEAQQPAKPAVTTLLDQYATGEYERALARAAVLPARALIDDLERNGASWIAAGLDVAPRRRAAATAFALELARSWIGTESWLPGRRLVAWGCRQWRASSSPTSAEEAWYRASIAVLEGAKDGIFLAGFEAETKQRLPRGFPLRDELESGHLRHAQTRFPENAYFRLASAVELENRTWKAGSDEGPRSGIPSEVGFERTNSRTAGREVGGTASIRALSEILAELTQSPTISAEASLRFGFVSLRLMDRVTALQSFARVESSTADADLVYLARFFSGIALERERQLDKAESAYRAALAAAPGAQSATTMLAVLLFRMGRRDEASTVTDAFFSSRRAVDPWQSYRLGDFRSWPSLAARLRESVQ